MALIGNNTTLRIGIPSAMGYYYLYPFFRTLLRELGAEPVVSPPTNARTLERMEACPTDEPCLAVKLHFGHADLLATRDDIDLICIPVITHVERTACCPKFIGIGDMVRHGLRLPESRMITPYLDYGDDDRALSRALRPLAARLGVTDGARLRRAVGAARETQDWVRTRCVDDGLTTPEVFAWLESGQRPTPPAPPADGPTIGLIGHPYVLYEPVSQGMVTRLRGYGRVVTAEMVAPAAQIAAMDEVNEGDRMWPFEAQLLGAALHLLRTRAVDKMILVGSFECGPESIIESYIEEEAERQGIPLMVLALDEHSGEAGLMTRLESFMDTEKTDGDAAEAPPPTPHVLTREEMVIGFPSMGHLDVAIRTALENLGVRTVPTPRTTQTCIEMGRALAPEFVCFPFTATLGQLHYLLEHGANTLLMVGGKQYCRLGWYAQVQEKLLRKLGYDFQLLIIDAPTPLRDKWSNFHQVIKTATGGASWPRILDALYTGFLQLQALDRADQVAHRLRALEREQGTVDRALDRFTRRMPHTRERRAIRALEAEFLAETAAIPTEDTRPLRVRIVGEIWVVLEQMVTRNVERWLGNHADPRVWVEREHSASHWFRGHILGNREALRRDAAVVDAARPWLAHKVGGHGQMTVGQMAMGRAEGVDGILHIFPFTCMPEIIAQNILVRMSEEFDLPVLTYIVSEQMGEAGMETRLESFLDVLAERREWAPSAVS
jgi:predicted nucleotide-binding protein (sugar kinase/HSP70/actin superfamily)